MPNTFDNTSFIPKKSLSVVSKKKSSVGLYFIIAVFLFIITAALSVGTFSYKKYLEIGIDSKAESLDRDRQAFDPALIEELIRLSIRVESTKKLLSSHISLTPFFALLEESTLKNVSFDSFELSVKDSGQVNVSMSGHASDYATVVLQSDILGQNRFLRNQLFSNINLDKSGNVSFFVNADVDPNLISYENNVEGF